MKGYDAGWASLQKDMPFLTKGYVDHGAGMTDPQTPIAVTGQGFTSALPDMHYDYIYQYVKVLDEGYPLYKDVYPSRTMFWNREQLVNVLQESWPMHPASVQYFKDVGLWTGAHQKHQDDQVKQEKLRLEAWEKAKTDAQARGIEVSAKNQEWLDYWEPIVRAIK